MTTLNIDRTTLLELPNNYVKIIPTITAASKVR